MPFMNSYRTQDKPEATGSVEEITPKAEALDGAVDFGYSIQVRLLRLAL
jgi:hypothetical protein